MAELKILNSREIRGIAGQVEEHYGVRPDFDYAWLQNNEGKIFLVSRKLGEIDTKKLRINSMGVYFCKVENGVRLTIEGCQMIKPEKNVVCIDERQLAGWMKGRDIEAGGKRIAGYVALRHGDDYVGCGFCKGGRIINYVAKGRRIASKTIE